jgi:hypothetical protein
LAINCKNAPLDGGGKADAKLLIKSISSSEKLIGDMKRSLPCAEWMARYIKSSWPRPAVTLNQQGSSFQPHSAVVCLRFRLHRDCRAETGSFIDSQQASTGPGTGRRADNKPRRMGISKYL